MKKYAITGASGYIGSHLANHLKMQKIPILLIARPQSILPHNDSSFVDVFSYENNIEQLAEILIKHQIQGVYHLASCFIKNHTSSDINPIIDANLRFGTHLAEACSLARVKWIINTSSFAQHYNNETYNPVNLYAASKKAFEDILAYYVKANIFKSVNLELFDTYGPNDPRPKIFNLWKKIAYTGEELAMSPGEQFINLIHVDDVVSAFLHTAHLLENNPEELADSESYTIYPPKPYRLRELAEIFSCLIGKKLNINWGARPYAHKEIMIPWKHGKALPGWKAKIDVPEGVKRSIDE